MAAPVGATIGLCGHGSKSSRVFPSDAFDFRRMQEQLEFPDKVVPQWFGHGLSLPPDSGMTWVDQNDRREGGGPS